MTSDEHSKNKLVFGRLSPDWLSRDFAAGRLRSRLESAVGTPTMPNAQCAMPNAQCRVPTPSAHCQMPKHIAQCPKPNTQTPISKPRSIIWEAETDLGKNK